MGVMFAVSDRINHGDILNWYCRDYIDGVDVTARSSAISVQRHGCGSEVWVIASCVVYYGARAQLRYMRGLPPR